MQEWWLSDRLYILKEVRNNMRMFIEQFDVTESELKNLRIRGTKSEDIKQALKDIYLD